ncbi:hypothetical protein ACLB2K_047170 [Fragaria x ananassa]
MSHSISSIDQPAVDLAAKELRLTINQVDEDHQCSLCCEGNKLAKDKEMACKKHQACIESWIHYCFEIAMVWVPIYFGILLYVFFALFLLGQIVYATCY